MEEWEYPWLALYVYDELALLTCMYYKCSEEQYLICNEPRVFGTLHTVCTYMYMFYRLPVAMVSLTKTDSVYHSQEIIYHPSLILFLCCVARFSIARC